MFCRPWFDSGWLGCGYVCWKVGASRQPGSAAYPRLVIDKLDWLEVLGVHRAALDRGRHLDIVAFAVGDRLGVAVAAHAIFA